jgi:hypothetical protein
VGQLESDFVAYWGAFVVLSNDERNLTDIGVQRWLRLDGGHLRKILAPGRDLTDLVAATGTTLMDPPGIGPCGVARLLVGTR